MQQEGGRCAQTYKCQIYFTFHTCITVLRGHHLMQDYIVDKSCLKNWLFPIVNSSDNVHSVENAFGGDYIAVIISNGWLLACCHIACWVIWHSFLLLPHVHSICFTPQSPSLSVMIGIWIYHCNETLTHSGLSKKSVGVVYKPTPDCGSCQHNRKFHLIFCLIGNF